jgi:hypothetical protein
MGEFVLTIARGRLGRWGFLVRREAYGSTYTPTASLMEQQKVEKQRSQHNERADSATCKKTAGCQILHEITSYCT